MTISVDEFHEIEDSAGCARFVNTNLHVHTPATAWDWDSFPRQTRKASSLSPDSFFHALRQTSLELIAVTDHNCVAWCEPLIRLAMAGRKYGSCRLHILPGVELTTYEGPHLLAIFDETQDVGAVRDMLVRLGMSGEGKEGEHISCQSPEPRTTIADAFAEVNKLGGVVIAPHVHSRDGLWGPKDFAGRTEILNDPRLRILAAPSGDIKRVVDGQGKARLLYKNMDTAVIRNSYAFINVSDCHRLEDLEIDTTWLKMSTPSLEGVKQIVYEPELRVAHELRDSEKRVEHPTSFWFCRPAEATHPWIVGLAVSGGMLEGQAIGFSPHQNCIIGKNYTGKSAVLDYIRFALDVNPQDDEAYYRYVDRLRGILTDGGQVRLYLRDSKGRTYGVSRTLSCTKIKGRKPTASWRLEGTPEVYSLWQEEFRRESDVSIDDIVHIEVYPQGEVVKIKDNATRQMTIVDALAQLEETLESLRADEVNGELTVRGRLGVNSRDIIRQKGMYEEIDEETGDIPVLESEIAELEELVKSPLFGEIQAWTSLEVRIDHYRKHLSRLKSTWEKLGCGRVDTGLPQSGATSLPEDTTASTEQSEVRKPEGAPAFNSETATAQQFESEVDLCYEDAVESLTSAKSTSLEILEDALATLGQFEGDSKRRLEEVKTNIREQARDIAPEEQQDTDLSTSLIDRITEKKRRLNTLRLRQEEGLEIKRTIEALEQEREALLAQYYQAWQEVKERRRTVVRMIDHDSADDIQAQLLEAEEREEYRALLEDIASRLTSDANRISRKDEQLSIIVEAVTPAQLVEIVSGGEVKALLNLAPGVTENTARVLLGMGLADIHRLQLCMLHDRFLIGLRKEGDQTFTPVDQGLSGGEQALALISVAMVPKGLPLVIDQPEDELGPALITNNLVEQIRRVKARRQLVFVTHVPNIPVLADSEQVVYMEQHTSAGGKSCKVKFHGSLENRDIVLGLLELDGGDIAFRKRSERYSSVVKHDRT